MKDLLTPSFGFVEKVQTVIEPLSRPQATEPVGSEDSQANDIAWHELLVKSMMRAHIVNTKAAISTCTDHEVSCFIKNKVRDTGCVVIRNVGMDHCSLMQLERFAGSAGFTIDLAESVVGRNYLCMVGLEAG